MFLLAIIEKETPEASKTTLLRLCQTRLVERPEAHEVFFALLQSILRALEAMSNERLSPNQFGETAWNWDFEFLIYLHPDYDNEMPFNNEATLYQPSKARHRCL